MINPVMEWLLEKDAENPGVRYFTLADLMDRPVDDPERVDARRGLMERGQVPTILAAQDPSGFWEEPGPGYNPKYRSTVWSIIYLAQLGADPADARVRKGGEYLLRHAIAHNGALTASGTPSGTVHCLAGNLGAALVRLGFGDDERLVTALDLTARYVTGDRIAPADERDEPVRYYAGLCGPGFLCGANDRLPCAWGAGKVLLALASVPEAKRTPAMRAALEATVEFLFSVDPATAGYPCGYSNKPSSSWFKFSFPVFYVTDVLQIAEALTLAGYRGDPRLANAYELILSKQDASGRWKMEYTYEGKTLADAEPKGKPSKWVTLRALRVLRKE
jgi:hypothetical protein